MSSTSYCLRVPQKDLLITCFSFVFPTFSCLNLQSRDPSVKRTMCKGCNTLLMPGVTAKVRVKRAYHACIFFSADELCSICYSNNVPVLELTSFSPVALPSHGHAVSYTCMNCSFSRRIPAPPTREHVAQPAQDPTDMQVDPVDEFLDSVKEEASTGSKARGKGKQVEKKQQQNRKKKRSIKPRPLPFFERPDHILFVGNERVDRTHEDGEPH